jgi:hypothetical protein
MTNEKSQKIPNIFCCESCDYNTSNKKDYDKHLLTAKHKRLTNANDFSPKNPKNPKENMKYLCNCGKEYKHSSSLCKHKNACKFIEFDKNDITDKELIMMLLHLFSFQTPILLGKKIRKNVKSIIGFSPTMVLLFPVLLL